ncbi:hypothetical protein GCM10009828_035220 [Actinoplanes couchii]|uniref:HTH cro/C1-type domain-containing protein n=2 Tax=Actinoplanes couchii TaxID=403638 RepID=A0ABQ3X911_9ACTN|nr:hypothetical protein Aco03nite_033900 [Actinoplanes couchii]
MVTTVAELGRQLTLMRLNAPRPTPAHEPLTLRELSRSTGIPRSTLGNAESGRILPRARVVYAFAKGCGVAEEQLAVWTEARNRLAHAVRNRRRDPDYALVGEVARRLAESSGDAPLQLARRAVESRSPNGVTADLDKVLEAMSPEECAEHLELMPPAAAAACLHLLAPQRGAWALEFLDRGLAAILLEAEDPAMAAEHLQLLDFHIARQVLPLIPTATTSSILGNMPRHDAKVLVSRMPMAWTSAVVLNEVVPVAMAADLLLTMQRGQRSRVLESAETSRIVGLLSALASHEAGKVLRGLSAAQVKCILMEMPDIKVARILGELPVAGVPDLLTTGTIERAATLLTYLSVGRAAEALNQIGPDRRAAILTRLPVDTRHGIEQAVAEQPVHQAVFLGTTFT